MAFSDRFLEELCARNDIVSLVSQYVSLTRRGGNYVGLCPFHNEKTASFNVSADRQFFHCFGCGAGGDVITFLMRIENLDFPDAVYQLAERAGMTVPENDNEVRAQKQKKDRILALNRDAARFFHTMLQGEEGKDALSYLLGRGLSPQTIKKFGLGFAPNAWDKLLKQMTEAGYTKQELLDAGLALPNKNGGVYDRFRNRVMFPIIDARGAVIAFGGRVMDGGEPKYLNSPETLVFNKRRNLFALNLAKMSKGERMILAEGYMDVIALHQAGFDCAVASLGTALTQEQARLIARYKSEVVIAYDADNAGVNAANRAIELLKEAGVAIKILRIPNAKDPDEFIKKFGRDKFERLLDVSEADLEYRLIQAQAGLDLEQDEGRVAYLKKAVKILCEVSSEIEREIYIVRAAKQVGIAADVLSREVARSRKSIVSKRKREQERAAMSPLTAKGSAARELKYQNPKSAVAEENLISLLMAQPELMAQIGDRLKPEQFSVSVFGKVFARMQELQKEGIAFSLTGLTKDCSSEETAILAGIFAKFVGGDSAALEDYLNLILQEQWKTKEMDSEAALKEAMAMFRKKKGSGE